jgi:NADH pyrophosphatase NudC (nudix superfamily)
MLIYALQLDITIGMKEMKVFMDKPKIRPIALCVFEWEGKLLLQEGKDYAANVAFYRPLGGGIEFGEHSREAVVREIKEELGAEITNLRYLDMVENIFTARDKPHHEIVMLYKADLVDQTICEKPRVEMDENGEVQYAAWVAIDDFKEGRAILYPQGLLKLLGKA